MNDEFFNKIISDDKTISKLITNKDEDKNHRIFFLINRIISNFKNDLIIVSPNNKDLSFISTIYSCLVSYYNNYENKISNFENWLKPGTYVELISSGEYDGTIFKYLGRKDNGIELETVPNQRDHMPGKIWQKVDNILQFSPTSKRKNKSNKVVSKVGKAIVPNIDKILGIKSFNNPMIYQNELIFLNTKIDFENKLYASAIFKDNKAYQINDLISFDYINDFGELENPVKLEDKIITKNLLLAPKISNIYNYFVNHDFNKTIICQDIKKVSNHKNYIQYRQIKKIRPNSKFLIFASDSDYEIIKDFKEKNNIDIYKFFNNDIKKLYSENKLWVNSLQSKIISNKKYEFEKRIVTIKVKEQKFDEIDNLFTHINKIVKKENTDTQTDIKIILAAINNLRFKIKDHIFGFPTNLINEIKEKIRSLLIEIKSRQTELKETLYDQIIKLVNKFNEIPLDGKLIFDARLKEFHELLKIYNPENTIIYTYNKDRKDYYEKNIKKFWNFDHKSILNLNSEVSFDNLIIPSEIITRDINKLINSKKYKNFYFIGSETLIKKMNYIKQNYEYKWQNLVINEDRKIEILRVDSSYKQELQNPDFIRKKINENINILDTEDFYEQDDDEDYTDDKNDEKTVPTIPITLFGDQKIYLTENFSTIILNPIFDQYSYKQFNKKKKSEEIEEDDIFMIRDSSDRDILETESSILYAHRKISYSHLKSIAFSTRDEIFKSFGINVDIGKLSDLLKKQGWKGSNQTLRNLISGETKCPEKHRDIDRILKVCEINNPKKYNYEKSLSKKILNHKKEYDKLRITAGKNITPKIYKALRSNPNISFDGYPLRVDYNSDGSISLGKENSDKPEAWIVQVKKINKDRKVKKNYNIVNRL